MWEYDFFAFLRGISEAQARADKKALAARQSEALLREEVGRIGNFPLRDGEGDREFPEGAERQSCDLRALLKFLGED